MYVIFFVSMSKDEKENLAKQLQNLMNQADLTSSGLAEVAELTIMTIYRLLNARTNPEEITLIKLVRAFEIERDLLTKKKLVKLPKIEGTSVLGKFIADTTKNPKYFISRKHEDVITRFLKNEFLNDDFLLEGRRAKEVARYIRENKKYKKNIDNKVIAKYFERFVEDDLLKREHKVGKGNVWFYSRKEN